jgi:hypothetical protein
MIGCSDVPACPPTGKENRENDQALDTPGRRGAVATGARKSRMDFGPEAE